MRYGAGSTEVSQLYPPPSTWQANFANKQMLLDGHPGELKSDSDSGK